MAETALSTAKADMHVHTRYSGWRHLRVIHPRDCYSPPAEVYRLALARGMSFVAISDHDTIEGAQRLLDSPGVDPSRVIVGEELECSFPETGQWVHLNVYGLTEEEHGELHRLKADARDVAAYCRGRGLLCVLNHPFQSFLGQKPPAAYLDDILDLFSHVEGLNGGVPEIQNRAVGRLCRLAEREGRHLTQVGGSDAHTRGRVGSAWTEARALDRDQFLSEIQAGRCQVAGRNMGTAGLVAEVYKVVGTYYARLYTGRGECRAWRDYAVDVAVATACLPAALGGLPAAVTIGCQVRQKAVSWTMLRAMKRRDLEGMEPIPEAPADLLPMPPAFLQRSTEP